MAHCLVTGGAGFIGSHIVAGLLQRGHAVRIVDNYATGKPENVLAVQAQLDAAGGGVRS